MSTKEGIRMRGVKKEHTRARSRMHMRLSFWRRMLEINNDREHGKGASSGLVVEVEAFFGLCCACEFTA